MVKKKESTALQIYYKISNTPLMVARKFGYIRTPVGKYIWIKTLDILVHEKQAKLINELKKINKSYEIMTQVEKRLVDGIIATNLR